MGGDICLVLFPRKPAELLLHFIHSLLMLGTKLPQASGSTSCLTPGLTPPRIQGYLGTARMVSPTSKMCTG